MSKILLVYLEGTLHYNKMCLNMSKFHFDSEFVGLSEQDWNLVGMKWIWVNSSIQAMEPSGDVLNLLVYWSNE
jgi:hypothetical protein